MNEIKYWNTNEYIIGGNPDDKINGTVVATARLPQIAAEIAQAMNLEKRFRKALAEFVGADTKEELVGMRDMLSALPIAVTERENMRRAIDLLLETLPDHSG